MKKNSKQMKGWLVMAAGLLLGMTSCSSDDSMIAEQLVETQENKAVGKVHIKVGAAISGEDNPDGQTRSWVSKNTSGGTNRYNLKLSTGDKVYLWRNLDEATHKVLAGYLTMVGSPNNGSNTTVDATFEGDLQVYQGGNESTFDFGDEDPLTGALATLVHEDAEEGWLIVSPENDMYPVFDSNKMIANSVSTLMSTALIVQGNYYNENRILMKQRNPILDFTINGLEGMTEYKFLLVASRMPDGFIGITEYDYFSSFDNLKMFVGETDYAEIVIDYTLFSSAENDFDSHRNEFAFCIDDKYFSKFGYQDLYWFLFIYNASGNAPIETIDLGQKSISSNSRIYKIERTVDLSLSDIIEPTITWTSVGEDTSKEPEYDEDNLCTYTVTSPGDAPIDITISDTSKGCRFNLTGHGIIHLNNLNANYDSPDREYFIYVNGESDYDNIIDISGDNVIKANSYAPIQGENLKLMGNGTLTIIHCAFDYDDSFKYGGIFSWDPKKEYEYGEYEYVSAADGYIVTRSEPIKKYEDSNGICYYSTTYTVRPE